MARKKRFTVTLDEEDYIGLQQLAAGQSPPLPLSYVVNYAIKRMLESGRRGGASLGVITKGRGRRNG